MDGFAGLHKDLILFEWRKRIPNQCKAKQSPDLGFKYCDLNIWLPCFSLECGPFYLIESMTSCMHKGCSENPEMSIGHNHYI